MDQKTLYDIVATWNEDMAATARELRDRERYKQNAITLRQKISDLEAQE